MDPIYAVGLLFTVAIGVAFVTIAIYELYEWYLTRKDLAYGKKMTK